MRCPIAVPFTALLLASLSALPALAGGPCGPDGWCGPHAGRYGHRAPAVYGVPADGSPAGREPVYFPGTGDASPNMLLGTSAFPDPHSRALQIVEYREPYIGQGLLYNVPPTVTAVLREAVVRARY